MKASPGFSLKLILILVFLGGLIALVAVPQYSSSVEDSMAEDAAAIVQMIATTNKMYSLDFHGQWTTGPVDNTCNSGECAARTGGAHAGCNLVACNYLAKQEWDSKKYNFYALDGAAPASTTNPCGNFPASKIWTSCGVRKSKADGDPAAPAFSAGWAYAVALDGVLHLSLVSGEAKATPKPSD